MTQDMKHWSEAAPIEPGMLIEITLSDIVKYLLIVNNKHKIVSLQGGDYCDVNALMLGNPSTTEIRFRPAYGEWSQYYTTKKPEETYKVGQRIKIAGFDDEYIIARVGFKTVICVNLTNGNHFGESYVVLNSTKITKSEMAKMLNDREFEIIR